MSHQLVFEKLFKYDSQQDGISVPVCLTANGQAVELVAKLDTGAPYCIFERRYGEELGISIEAGQSLNLSSATGDGFRTFGHEVTLEFLGFEVQSTVYFAAEERFSRNVLGRTGWLNKCRVAIVDHDQHLYVSPYE